MILNSSRADSQQNGYNAQIIWTVSNQVIKVPLAPSGKIDHTLVYSLHILL